MAGFPRAMLVEPEFDDETDIAPVRRSERDGEEVRLWFRYVSEAVSSKLKYA